MGEKLENTAGCVFAILFFGFGLLQLGAGWAGIEHSFGWGWGVAAAVAAIGFRFTLPIAVGAFLCAKNIWGWHWVFAALFAAPGLLFMVPAFFSSLVGAVKR
ncbi:hypothetical protein [Rhodanobacter soli]|jgi:hypothetical protein|uniref:Major facilitator superfamily (MFS) profile domain-containing protein n=1 Tax=Rhodanobacter soli TaxID=590609 RepID=A0ABV2Q064_9GAMM